jgi:hypothetical protein
MSDKEALAFVAASLVLAIGCEDPLVEPELIVDMRVLGAKATTAGDPSRATPRPGEDVRVRWLVAGPSGPIETTHAFRACLAEPTTSGYARCRETIDDALASDPSAAAPTLSFSVPAAELLQPDDRLGVLGVVCDGGAPALAEPFESSSCEDGAAKATLASFEIEILTDPDEENHNPDPTATWLRFDGQTWPPRVGRALSSTCPPADGDSTLVVSADGADHTIELDPSGLREVTPSGPRETLEIAHLVTGGDLARHFTAVESDEPEPPALQSVTWKAPASVSSPTFVHFYAVVRDLRGGVGFAHRALCIVAP